MAAPLTPDRLIAALEKWDVPYKLYPGWKTRTRPGGCNPIGFIIHHTGGGSDSVSYLKFLFETGRPAEGIPGPLCQFAIGGTGTVHVGSIGRANHAGMGSSATRAKVGAENYAGYTSEIAPGRDDVNGNGLYWGVEVIYPGTSPMSAAPYRSAVRLAAAIVDAYGWTALSVIGHREHSGRKWDPGQCPMAKFRRDVRDLLAAGPGGAGTPTPTEDFMGFVNNQDEFNTALARALEVVLEPKDLTRNPPQPVHRALTWFRVAPWHQILGKGPQNMHGVMGELRAAVTGSLPELIREAGDEIGLTPEQTEQLATSVAAKVERVTVVVEDGE